MFTIIVNAKPTSGKRDRICRICGYEYNGWNMYVCHSCERVGGYIVEERWH